MSGRMGFRALVTLVGALVGAVLLSGSDQPVTAHAYPRWQEVPAPPLTARTHALGVHVGHWALVLGGVRPDGSVLRDGAAYDVRTGRWHRVWTPVAMSDRDTAVVAARVVVLRQVRPGRPASWWRYAVRQDAWSRLRGVPQHAAHPSSFGSEVYVLSGRRVVVYSVQLGRWTPLPADRLRPRLVHRTVTASRHGTVVTGAPSGHPRRVLADRWDGLRWRRSGSVPALPVTAAPSGATRVRIDGRTLVVRDGRAWIRLP
jgi:hypothetical protein